MKKSCEINLNTLKSHYSSITEEVVLTSLFLVALVEKCAVFQQLLKPLHFRSDQSNQGGRFAYVSTARQEFFKASCETKRTFSGNLSTRFSMVQAGGSCQRAALSHLRANLVHFFSIVCYVTNLVCSATCQNNIPYSLLMLIMISSV